jgi:uncharacterized protein (TIGR03437 family)
MRRAFRPLAVLCLYAPGLLAQRIPARIDDGQRISLPGAVRALPQDAGAVEPNFALPSLILYLKQSSEQRQSLTRFLGDLQNPASPNYRKFVTPDQYADRFGLDASDIDKIRAWLESQGFQITQVSRSRTWIAFQGTSERAQRAFGAEIHRYRDRGQIRYANTRSISIPAALDGVVAGVRGLDDFVAEPEIRFMPAPEFNSSDGSHRLAPDDLATIYDIAPLYAEGIDGSGQTIAIVGASHLNLSDVAAFRTRFNLPANVPQTVLVPGFADPGSNSAAVEAALDVEWSGAVARSANILYVYSIDPYIALQYVVDQNLAPVVSASYSFSGRCEQAQDPGTLAFFQQLAQQASAQGITWVNSSGDAGAAGCDPNGYPLSQNGAAARFPASIPEVTAAGGTQFDESGGAYWNTQNDASGASAVSYIPERAWNESAADQALWAGGGGVSIFFPKPSWQAGPGVPNDGYRDLPDVALSAAAHDGYFIYFSGSTGTAAGTSAAAPVFAGMLALVNQSLVAGGAQSRPRLGNVNPLLYRLAESVPQAFHDVATGDNIVPCAAPNCPLGSTGYGASAGYDLATGLGSPDLHVLLHQWSTQSPKRSQVSVSFSANPVYEQVKPGRGVPPWSVTITLTEEEGVATSLTDFTVDGKSFLSLFPNTTISAYGRISTTLGYSILNTPVNITFGFTGADAGGTQWSRQISVPFLGLPAAPAVSDLTNTFSYDHSYAPGMLLTVWGTNLGAALQATAAVPLESYMGGFYAAVNGVRAPLFYVSPTQVNIQIPYEVTPGVATLIVYTSAGSSSFSFQVSPAAPGILLPNASGSPGQIYTLYVTGDGLVTPAVPDGSTPSGSAAPRPRLPVTVTIGSATAPIQFIGIPGWSIGATQINFQVPPDAPPGPQDLVVTVGASTSAAVKFTVTP